jgi:hypothetical protein
MIKNLTTKTLLIILLLSAINALAMPVNGLLLNRKTNNVLNKTTSPTKIKSASYNHLGGLNLSKVRAISNTYSNIQISPNPLRAGNNITVSMTITGHSAVTTNTVDVYISSDQILTKVAADGDFYLGQLTLPNVADGGQVNFSQQLATAVGTYVKNGTTWYVVLSDPSGATPPIFNPVTIGAAPVITTTPQCFGLSSRVLIKWPAAKNATSYDILRDNIHIASASAAAVSYLDSTVVANSTYTYEVKPIGGSGFSGLAVQTANAASCTVPLPVKPVLTVTPFCVNTMAHSVYKSYIQIAFTVENPTTTYSIFVNGVSRGHISGITKPVNTYNEEVITPGTFYNIIVKAENSSGYIYSSTDTVTAITCGSGNPGPVMLTATPQCSGIASQVLLNWNAPANVVNYDIYKDGALYKANYVGNQLIDNSNIADTTSYSYYVVAKGGDFGTATNSNTVQVKTSYCSVGGPPGPFKLVASGGCNGSELFSSLLWTDGGRPYAASYDIYRQGVLIKANYVLGLAYQDKTVLPNTLYSYYIVAKNSVGSVTSNTVQFTTPTCAPVPPVVQNISPLINKTGDVVTISGNGFTNTSTVSFGGVAAASVTYVSQDTLKATVGAGASGNTTVTTAVGTSSLPGFLYDTGIQLGITAQAICNHQTSQVQLTWTAASDATSYDIFRDTTLIATQTPARGVTFIDSNTRIITGRTYVYQVRANTPVGLKISPPQSVVAVECIKPFLRLVTGFCDVNPVRSNVMVYWQHKNNATAYRIYRDSVLLTTITDTSEIYTDHSAEADSTYTYYISEETPFGIMTSDLKTITASDCGINRPDITKVSSLYLAKGDTVTITGTKFTGVTSVTFGGVNAKSFTVVSPTTITAIVDSAAPAGSVVVTSRFGAASINYTQFGLPQTIIMKPEATVVYGTDPNRYNPAISTAALPIRYSASSNSIVNIFTTYFSVQAAGRVIITATQPGNTTYLPAQPVTQILTVMPAQLTIIANDQTRAYNTANLPLTASYKGFYRIEDSLSINNTFPVLSTTATATSLPGKYPIVASGAVTANYTVTYVAGTLTITPPPAPVITSFTPQNAIAGTTVTITGTNLTDASAVSFGGAAASSVTVNSPTSVSAVVGSGSSGVISLTTPGGTTTLPGFSFVYSLPATNFRLSTVSATCKGSANGSVTIDAAKNLNYTATITGNGVNTSYPFVQKKVISALAAGTYQLCITVAGQAGYRQCFDVVITEPKDLSLYSTVNEDQNTVTLNLDGANQYSIRLNGVDYSSSTGLITLPLAEGTNSLQVSTDKLCQGVIEKTITILKRIVPFPDPFTNMLKINFGSQNISTITVEIFSVADGKTVYSKKFSNISGVLQLDVSDLKSGIFAMHVHMDNHEKIFKIFKK